MTAPNFPADFLDRLDRAVSDRDGTPDKRGETRFRCPNPDHPDEHPSARWNRKKAAWTCDVCQAGGGALDLADKLGVEKPTRKTSSARAQRSRRESVKPADSSDKSPSQAGETGEGDVTADGGLTLAALAEAKKLPLDFLGGQGVRDQTFYKERRVVIPYLDADGQEATIRYRHSLTGGKRFSYRSGDKPMLYGLHGLAAIRTAGWALLVEGESDCWTCWLHGLPALGIPGKSSWKPEWAKLLEGIDVFLWQEPDADDLSERVMRDLSGVRIIAAPEETKDLAEAHCRGDDVPALVKRLKASAVTAEDLRRRRAEAERAPLRERAFAVLTADDPLAIVEKEIARLGYGGDRTPALITYLSLTTRLLAMRRGAMPAHLLLLGPPSAGKSYTLAIVLLLLPPRAYHVIDAGSPRVLIYDTADLQHRVVIFSEADSLPAGEDNPAASALRNLLQDHHLHYKVTIRDAESGAFTVHEIDKPGPTILVTTAVKSLGEQLMTRLFALPVPEDVKRQQQALDTQATIELDGAAEPNETLIAFQAYLQTLAPWDVVVPFARELSTAIGASANAVRLLRDYQRLLSLIKAAAILRHHRRERNGNGRLVATIADYRAVYDLIGPMFEATISGKTEAVRKVVDAVAELSKGDTLADRVKGAPITYAAVARFLGMHPQQAKRAALVAIGCEWLVNDEDKPNKSAKLRIGEPMPEIVGLPTPEQVEAAFTASSQVSRRGEGDLADKHTGFTHSQPDRKVSAGTLVDVSLSPMAANGHAPNGADPDDTLPPPFIQRSTCETVKPDEESARCIICTVLPATDGETCAGCARILAWRRAREAVR